MELINSFEVKCSIGDDGHALVDEEFFRSREAQCECYIIPYLASKTFCYKGSSMNLVMLISPYDSLFGNK